MCLEARVGISSHLLEIMQEGGWKAIILQNVHGFALTSPTHIPSEGGDPYYPKPKGGSPSSLGRRNRDEDVGTATRK